jgi:putative ABC transport system permease protein
MIRHLARLVWNRRKSNLLVGLEILVSFLILAVIGISGFACLAEVYRPRGFDCRDLWIVDMNPDVSVSGGWGKWTPADSAAMRQVYRVLRDFDAVAGVTEADPIPFYGEGSDVGELHGRRFDYYVSYVGDPFPQVMPVDLTAGRWFGPEDDGLAVEPVVLTQGMARFLFGKADPLGEEIVLNWRNGLTGRVVGVVSRFRPFVYMEDPAHFLFRRVRPDRPVASGFPDLPTSFLLRVEPGTPRRFEAEIAGQLRRVAPGWEAYIAPLSEIRAENLRNLVRPLLVFGVISGFLLLMVALGLVGILWQSVTQRTREIGVRRAAGANRGQIYLQFAGEVLALTSAAVAVGAVLVFHAAVLDLGFFPSSSAWVCAAGLLAATAVLYVMVAAAVLYPGWLATRIPPAQALHYD